ncbi:hypothetical protein ACROYT_G005029 [Oculina patagonica]
MLNFKKWLKAVFSEEFRIHSLSLKFPNAELFSESPWFPPALFIIYRLVVTSCCVIFTVESVFYTPSYLWLVQFDNWSITAVCFYFTLATLLLIYDTIKTYRENNSSEDDEKTKHEQRPESGQWGEDHHGESESELLWAASEGGESHPGDHREADNLPCYHKVVWLLQTIAANSILVVTFCYLILEEKLDALVLAMYLSFNAFMMADAVFSFAPIRLLHFVYSYVFTLAYVLVVVLYYVAVVDRHMPELPRFVNRIQGPFSSAMVFVILIIGQPLFQMLFFIVHKLNCFVYIKYYGY